MTRGSSQRFALCVVAAALIIIIILLTGCGSSSSKRSATTTPTVPRRGFALLEEPYRKPSNPGPHPGAKIGHLVIKDVIRGTGQEIHAGDSGVFDFIASDWVTGRPIESSWKRPRPFETRIEHNIVIDGWWQGIPGMRVGGERRLIIPPDLGFTQGMNPEVEGSTLYYDVVLLGVRPLEPPGMAAEGSTQGGATPPPSSIGTPSG